jgi:hypothetical protein
LIIIASSSKALHENSIEGFLKYKGGLLFSGVINASELSLGSPNNLIYSLSKTPSNENESLSIGISKSSIVFGEEKKSIYFKAILI